jgi:hypothetical protein
MLLKFKKELGTVKLIKSPIVINSSDDTQYTFLPTKPLVKVNKTILKSIHSDQ